MSPTDNSLFSSAYLRREFGSELEQFRHSEEEAELLQRLRLWSERQMHNEVTAQGAFVGRFFQQLWGYTLAGEEERDNGYSAFPQYPIQNAGGGGGTGFADLALGWFGLESLPPVPQAICEFKDVWSGLDMPQHRKGDTRTPVRQCATYLREVRSQLHGNEPVQPQWGIVTDMNEFRLYRRNEMPGPFQRFVIRPQRGEGITSLLDANREGSFQRLVFARLFHRDRLIARAGDPPILRDLRRELVREQELEEEFYRDYRFYRERLIDILRTRNPRFPGTPGRLVRLAQTILDRAIFVLFCEDMGRELSFPPRLLTTYLEKFSTAEMYSPDGEEVWSALRQLFDAMDHGGRFQEETIQRFNGGLFAQDAELDGLHIPNTVFCERNQGAGSAQLQAAPQTLLYLASKYNFGVDTEGKRITLYTLGRIFEQSITELEALEAEADGKPSLTKLGKRKRDGVYYTPEWVVRTIVEETLGSRLAELRSTCQLSDESMATLPDRGTPAHRARLAALENYLDLLQRVTVVDPACGSGAFLIHALEYLLQARQQVVLLRSQLTGSSELFEQEEQIRDILSRNVYGIDINPASVEIARLALWLHTAQADRPLCDLDHNVRTGNSLISERDMQRWNPLLLPEGSSMLRERINAFSWREAFPEIAEQDGFDCVVGNPPYVKLQNFRKVQPEVSDFLRNATARSGGPLYYSTQSGNFDLFLPFIEQGIRMLKPDGRMGIIAPSLWLLNEYGSGLRRRIHANRNLDRWVDFKSFQVFEEAITYTALQFFTRRPNEAVRFFVAADGAVTTDWRDTSLSVPYTQLPADDTWILLPEKERLLLNRLASVCDRLDSPAVTRQIFQGIITSADSIYHLQKIAPGLYRSFADKSNPVEVEIEDTIMRPLLSGPEVCRYTEPQTDTFLMLPYAVDEYGSRLVSQQQMVRSFPQAWAYLTRHEQVLRARDNGRVDSAGKWWGYVYPKNIDKQHLPKLGVPRLLQRLECAIDLNGTFAFDNVDVGGVLLQNSQDIPYIAALLNGPVLNFIWRRLSKPFQNDYRSANKQFIAPLPIPRATTEQKQRLGRRALLLEEQHTQFRDLDEQIARRFLTVTTRRTEDWLLPMVGTLAAWKTRAPASLSAGAKKEWALKERGRLVENELARIAVAITRGGDLRAEFRQGELRVMAGSTPVVDRVYVGAEEGPFLAALWQRSIANLGGRVTAERLIDALRSLREPLNQVSRDQIVALQREADEQRALIRATEAEMNSELFDLYELTAEERQMIKAG